MKWSPYYFITLMRSRPHVLVSASFDKNYSNTLLRLDSLQILTIMVIPSDVHDFVDRNLWVRGPTGMLRPCWAIHMQMHKGSCRGPACTSHRDEQSWQVRKPKIRTRGNCEINWDATYPNLLPLKSDGQFIDEAAQWKEDDKDVKIMDWYRSQEEWASGGRQP